MHYLGLNLGTFCSIKFPNLKSALKLCNFDIIVGFKNFTGTEGNLKTSFPGLHGEMEISLGIEDGSILKKIRTNKLNVQYIF